jgi:hypothetical protein
MRPDLVPISKLLEQIKEEQHKLEKSHEQTLAAAKQIASLFESLSNEVKRAPVKVVADVRQAQWNQQFLKLQQAMQHENRNFTSISNVLKTKHDTAKNAIHNVR